MWLYRGEFFQVLSLTSIISSQADHDCHSGRHVYDAVAHETDNRHDLHAEPARARNQYDRKRTPPAHRQQDVVD